MNTIFQLIISIEKSSFWHAKKKEIGAAIDMDYVWIKAIVFVHMLALLQM